MRMRDLLTGEERRVTEGEGTRGMQPRAAMCARVVDWEGLSLLIGAHSRTLPPVEAAEAARFVRKGLRTRRKVIPPADLRGDGAYAVLAAWEDLVAFLEQRPLPQLRNSEGHVLQFTEDRFTLSPGARAEVEKRVAGLSGVEGDAPGADAPDGATGFVFLQDDGRVDPGRPTVVAHAYVTDEDAVITTNSETRADAARRQVEQACGGLLTHKDRSRKDAQDLLASAQGRKPRKDAPDPDFPPEEADRLVREFKERHYADWIDHPLPALDGKTPREAAATAAGREKVKTLLREMEMHESGQPPGVRYDFGRLWKALGLRDR
jgi:hypothetical protein